MKTDYKCILSVRVGRHLLTYGFRLTDIEPGRKFNGQLVFVFENTPDLDAEIAKFNQNVSKRPKPR